MMRATRAALAGVALLVLTVAAPSSVAAEASEMEILDMYLEQFDTWRGAQGVGVEMVQDRCHRTGGTEDTSKLPPLASLDSTNDLMFQHARWHGEHGRFLEPVFTWSDSDPYGLEFLEYHRDLILTYGDWRLLNGHPALVAWDPMTPIPASLAYPVDLPCRARESEDPKIALPTYLTVAGGTNGSPFWGYAALCEIPDANRLGKTIEGSWYHADVHLTIGGDMADAGLTLRDPVFWPWHVHVQSIYETWMTCEPPQVAAASDPAPRETPGFGLPLALLGVLAMARVTKRK